MPIIKSLREFNWDLSRKGFRRMLHSTASLITEENKLKKWVYLYTFLLVPILNVLISMIQESRPVSLASPPPTFIFSPINMILMSFLITFTIFSFILSLLIFNRVRPVLFASLFTQILILFFEINIIRKYTLSYTETENLSYLLLILVSLSILYALIQLSKMIYLGIRDRIVLKRKLKNSSESLE